MQDASEFLGRFGLAAFRPGQRDVIDAVLAGEDCLCIMPTGGGKSLCYQLPSLMRPGVTLVVSPLIALMKDQVDVLQRLNLRASFVNSSLPPAEQAERLATLQAGGFDLFYVAPERFRSPRFIEALKSTKIELLAIDEAHCISEWGHDFRPDYAKLGWFRKQLGQPPTIALTATATPKVRGDVMAQLALRTPRVFVAGFSRPNLRFEVTTTRGIKEKRDVLLEFLKQTPGCGIIYTSARKRCDEVAEIVATTGRKVGVYHAGLMPDDRRQAQDDFMRGRNEIVVATVAFGMGIDKADVRFVVHYNMPGSIEAYYQEAGRAGRDQKTSRCMLIYTSIDRRVQEYFIENAYPPREVMAEIYDYLCRLDDDPIERTQQEIKDALKLSVGPEGVGACLQLLEKAGGIERHEPLQNRAIVRLKSDVPTLVDFLPKTAKSQRKVLALVEKIVGERRFEDVYFHPRALVERAEMDLASIGRALRELKRLESFDYVPPFRGRALRIVDRAKKFHDLPIDFETFERRKAAEYEKLDAMVAYANGRGCRQLEFLKYFGETKGSRCGSCDQCLPSGGAQDIARSATDSAGRAKLLRAVRIALSGIARTEGRIGRQMVAQMLAGSRAGKISKLKLDELSTFGLLKPLSQQDIQLLLDVLLNYKLAEQQDIQRNRPVLRLTDLGREVMQQRAELPDAFQVPPPLAEAISLLSIAPSEPSPEAVPSVPQVRRVPPATVPPVVANVPDENIDETPFPDAHELSSAAPRRRIDTPAPAAIPPHDNGKPDHYWVWRLLNAGFKRDECAAICKCSEARIVELALAAVEAGMALHPKWVLSSDEIAAMKAMPRRSSTGSSDALAPELPQGVTPAHVQLFAKGRW